MSLIAVYVCGVVTFVVGLYHVRLYKIRNWEENLKAVDLFTQKVIYTINMALSFLFFIISILSFIYAVEMSKGIGFAFGFNVSLCCFWIWRVVWGHTYLKEISNKKVTFFDMVKRSVGPILIISYLIPIIGTIAACLR
jgi:hypothetical protein